MADSSANLDEKARQIQNLAELHAKNMQRLQQEQDRDVQKQKREYAKIIESLAEKHRNAVETANSMIKRVQHEQERERDKLREQQEAETNALHKKFEQICKQGQGSRQPVSELLRVKEAAGVQRKEGNLTIAQKNLQEILRQVYRARWLDSAIIMHWQNVTRGGKKTMGTKEEILQEMAALCEKPADTVRILLQHHPWKGSEKMVLQLIVQVSRNLKLSGDTYSMHETTSDLFKKLYGEDLHEDQHMQEEFEEGDFDRAALKLFLENNFTSIDLKKMLKEIAHKIPSSASSTNGDKGTIAGRISELAAKPSQVFALMAQHVELSPQDKDKMQEACKAFREMRVVQQDHGVQSSGVDHIDLVGLLAEVEGDYPRNKKQRV